MKGNYMKSILGGTLAFILGTSCCWLTSLAVWLGGATILMLLSNFVDKYSSIILTIAFLLFMIAAYQFRQHRKKQGM